MLGVCAVIIAISGHVFALNKEKAVEQERKKKGEAVLNRVLFSDRKKSSRPSTASSMETSKEDEINGDVVKCPYCAVQFISEKARKFRTMESLCESVICLSCNKIIAGVM